MFLLINNASKVIQYAQVIHNFTMLAQYILYNDKTLCYIKHVLYKLKNTKIAFKHHQSIYLTLYQPTFIYYNIYTICYFVQYIQDYGSVVNYNIAHKKVVYKYLLQAFYNWINKKKYDLQIWQHNICHTNIITMKYLIISRKVMEENMLSKGIMDTNAPIEMAQILSPIDFARRYNKTISNANLDWLKELGLTSIKKY